MLAKRLRQSGVVVSCLLGSVLSIALVFLGWQRFAPAATVFGRTYRVVLEDIPHVSTLVRDLDGLLYVSQELQDGKGLVFRIAADGSRDTVLNGLSKPDGMASFHDGIAISQEQGTSPVFWRHVQQARPLLDDIQVEDVASGGRYLYAAENRDLDGWVLRYDPETGGLTVLREGLQRSERVATCPDGSIFYTEKKRNHVMRLHKGAENEVVLNGLNALSFLLYDSEGLWITENPTHNARTLLLPPDGPLQMIVRRLRSAQSLLPIGPGRYLLAGQGRNRILEIERQKSGL